MGAVVYNSLVEIPSGTSIDAQVLGAATRMERALLECGRGAEIRDIAAGIWTGTMELNMEFADYTFHQALLDILTSATPGQTTFKWRLSKTDTTLTTSNPQVSGSCLIVAVPQFGGAFGEVTTDTVTVQFRPGITIDMGAGGSWTIN